MHCCVKIVREVRIDFCDCEGDDVRDEEDGEGRRSGVVEEFDVLGTSGEAEEVGVGREAEGVGCVCGWGKGEV